MAGMVLKARDNLAYPVPVGDLTTPEMVSETKTF